MRRLYRAIVTLAPSSLPLIVPAVCRQSAAATTNKSETYNAAMPSASLCFVSETSFLDKRALLLHFRLPWKGGTIERPERREGKNASSFTFPRYCWSWIFVGLGISSARVLGQVLEQSPRRGLPAVGCCFCIPALVPGSHRQTSASKLQPHNSRRCNVGYRRQHFETRSAGIIVATGAG